MIFTHQETEKSIVVGNYRNGKSVSLPNEPVYRAAVMYLLRNVGNYMPHGKTDSAGRWYPADDEICPHCASVRTPSRNWRYSLLKHAKTMKHILALNGVEDQRKLVNEIISAIFEDLGGSNEN